MASSLAQAQTVYRCELRRACASAGPRILCQWPGPCQRCCPQISTCWHESEICL